GLCADAAALVEGRADELGGGRLGLFFRAPVVDPVRSPGRDQADHDPLHGTEVLTQPARARGDAARERVVDHLARSERNLALGLVGALFQELLAYGFVAISSGRGHGGGGL